MYGWRARLGIILPSGNIVTEPEFNLMTPEGVSCHYQRFALASGGLENLKELEELILDF